MDRQTLVVIGHGMASHALCKRLVELGVTRGQLRVVVLGEEPRPAYDRVHLTELLGGKTEDDLTLAPASWYAEHDIELVLGDPVVAIDRADCVVRSRSGLLVPFDRLVLATGSRAFIPPIPGADLPGVLGYRTVDDVHAVLAHAGRSSRAAVVGGGLLGLEAAGALHGLGLEVTILEASPGLLSRQLDLAGAGILRGLVEELGVRVRTAARTVHIEGGAGEKTLHLQDGARIEADLVIFAAGIRPRGELAAAAGLITAPSGAVVVDDRLATSDERIFAVGECAAHRGVTHGLLAPGVRMVDVLVTNLGGGDAIFTGASPSARLKLLGVDVASIGEHDERRTPGSAAHTYLVGTVYRKLVIAGGQIVGALAVGPWDDLGRVQEAIESPRRFSFWDLRRFRGTGSLFLRSESPPVHLWPEGALVCGCLGVRRGTLSAAEATGCETVTALSARTGAGTLCGSCRPLLADFLLGGRADSSPASAAHPEEPPPTLRSKPGEDGQGPASEGPLSLPASLVPSARARLSTLPSAVRLSLLDHRPTLVSETRPAGARASLPVVATVGEGGCAPVVELRPALLPPDSSVRSSRPLRPPISTIPESLPGPDSVPPPSTRRETLPPLRPLSVPSSRLPSLPPPRSLPGPTAREARLARALLIASGASLALSLLALVAPPLPPPTSHRGLHLAAILAGAAARRITGGGMLALSVAGLALSAGKRMERFKKLDFPTLRLVHGALGAGALVCLLLHTGLGLGHGGNRLLALDFLALSTLGGVAGALAALGGLDPGATRRRHRVLRAHLLLFLPLPALVVLHVLDTFYF